MMQICQIITGFLMPGEIYESSSERPNCLGHRIALFKLRSYRVLFQGDIIGSAASKAYQGFLKNSS